MSTQVVYPSDGVIRGFAGLYSTADPASDGSVTIDTRDIPEAIRGGFSPVFPKINRQVIDTPAAASTSLVVAPATIANGTLAIAAQPDVARQLQVVATSGTPGITAGILTVPYTANDGSSTSDVFALSLIGASNHTYTSSKGAMHVGVPVIAGLAGGTTPSVHIGTNAVLSVPVPPGATSAALLKEDLDGADAGTPGVLTNKGLYTPNTAPNGTHTYEVDYTFLAP